MNTTTTRERRGTLCTTMQIMHPTHVPGLVRWPNHETSLPFVPDVHADVGRLYQLLIVS